MLKKIVGHTKILTITLFTTLSIGWTQEFDEAGACKSLFEDKFEEYTVLSVQLCNMNLFSPNVYMISFLDSFGEENYRQCLVGGGWVRIPSAFSEWKC